MFVGFRESLDIVVPCCVPYLHHILCTACMSLGLNDGSEEAWNLRGNAETITSELSDRAWGKNPMQSREDEKKRECKSER